jgi:hypothetical protein
MPPGESGSAVGEVTGPSAKKRKSLPKATGCRHVKRKSNLSGDVILQ